VKAPAPDALIARIRALPAAPPLLSAIGDATGVYLVGGAVRDVLLGVRSADLDLVVEGDPAIVAARLGGELRVHDRFGTATVIANGHTYDVARARRETYAAPGALPDVEPAGLDEDLRRRDFTVNAAAIELSGPRAGELRAEPESLEDLGSRQLRVLHDQSFIDDPTRLLRLARYSGRLGFEVEAHTAALAAAAVSGGALATVSGSRIGAELRLLAREDDPVETLGGLSKLGIDTAIEPGFGLHDVDLAHRALGLLPAGERRDLLALALTARGVPEGRLGQLLDRMAFEAAERDVILAAATRAPAVAQALSAVSRPSELVQAAAGAGAQLVALAGGLGPADAAREWLERIRHLQLEIDGADLLAAGVPEGPAIGRGLRAALAAKLDGHTSDREAELAQALAAALGSR